MTFDLPKQDWVKPRILIDFLREGYWKGHLAAEITFTGAVCPSQETMLDVIEAVLGVQKLLPPTRIIRFTGLINPLDSLMTLFVRSLRSYGFNLQAEVKDMPVERWDDGVWLIYRTSKDIVPFVVSEVWYAPNVEADADELPDIKNMPPSRSTYLYLDKSKGYSTKAVMDFMAKSPRVWVLL